MLLSPSAPAQDSKDLLEQADEFAYDGKLNLARKAYESAIQAGGRVDNDFVRSRNLALCYLNGQPQNLPLAAQWFETAIRLRPTAEETRFLFAQALGWGAKYDQAALQYKLLLNTQPASADYIVGLSNTLYWKGDTAQALKVLEQFLERSPSLTPVRLHYARMLGYAKRYTDALNQYQAVLQNNPNDVGAQVGIAKITSWQNRLDLALNMFNNILQKNPGNYDALVGKAYTTLWLGEREQARKLFAAALDRDPGDKEVKATLRALSSGSPRPPVAVRPVLSNKPKVEAAKAAPPTPAPKPAPVVPPPAEVATKTEVIPPPEKVDPLPGLLTAAENAAGRRQYTEAIHHYHQALALKPGDVAIQLQIARVLSWSKDYKVSVAQYDELLKSAPENLFAQTERARVLSWDKNFEPSLAGYKTVLELAQRSPNPPVPVNDIRQEYARVLSWNKQLDESLAQYQLLLPSESAAEVKDVPVLLEKARVLAWSRRYDESIATYESALALDAANFDAKLGRAQTTFWAGRLEQSSAQLNDLLKLQPRHPETSFTLAAVEHGRGNNARSLNLLKVAPANEETEGLKRSIRGELRPLLRFRYGFEDDREIVNSSLDSTTKVLRYSTALDFNFHPDVRMTVSNTTTQALTSNSLLSKHGAEGIAVETMAHANFKVSPWLRMIVGAGAGQTGRRLLQGVAPNRNHFVFDVHPIITRGNFRSDIAITRHIADYTPLAIHDNVVQTRFSAGASYNWRKRVSFAAEYWHGHYQVDSPDPTLQQSFTAGANGGSVSVTPVLYRSDRLTLDAGLRYESFTFGDDAERILTVTGVDSAGFFTPRIYQRIAGTAHAAWDPHRRVHWEFHGTFGPQRIYGFDSLNPPPPVFGATGSFGSQLSLNLGRLRPSLAYDFFATKTPASPGLRTGQYRSNVLSLGLSYRF
ncbi:MAG TPA: tetratricopeptide repeat protein [Terriglobales bacterium]|nr:tetratricopeptide repeat protein [Terriglobales bacterium]